VSGEKLRLALADARETPEEAIKCARLSYQFNANAYAYEAMSRCMRARDAVVGVSGGLTDLSHYVEAFEQCRRAKPPKIFTSRQKQHRAISAF
jgi:hypothetical protein